MAQAHHDHGHVVTVQPRDTVKIWKIWKTMIILAVLTAIEFILAFAMDRGHLLTSIFVVLTFAKTFFIVGEFMHLKYEVKVLILSIVIPMLFIVWLIVAMLAEGSSVETFRDIWGMLKGE
ncbi:MAG: cytochrome C oxidase subunit IV family protein [Cytophagaceae bacterium]|nr:cytochrome C oxidase subunit IV family protein [Cytophagaceae bacterium]